MTSTVSLRTLLSYRHIFRDHYDDNTGKVWVWDFQVGKALVHSRAFSPHDMQRLTSNWAKSFKVPPEAIVDNRRPEDYKADILRRIESYEAD